MVGHDTIRPDVADVTTILGGPGAGKTTRLLEIVESELASGLSPEEIAFVSFTRKAADEAASRAMAKFGVARDDLPHFRTIHSACYRALGLSRDQIMDDPDWKDFGEVLGMPVSPAPAIDGPPTSGNDSARILGMVSLARATCQPIEVVWHSYGLDVGWHEVKRFVATLTRYKKDAGKMDFDDLLDEYLAVGSPLSVRVAVVDEGQDLSTAQWRVVAKMFEFVDRLYLGGDDDQCIYQWSGADLPEFRSWMTRGRVEVLPMSHRLPSRLKAFAQGVLDRVHERYPKEWSPRAEGGTIARITHPEQVDLSTGTWYLLSRNNRYLAELEEVCYAQGVAFTTATGSSVDDEHVRAIVGWERLRKGQAERVDEDMMQSIDRFRRKRIEPGSDVIWHDALKIPEKAREHYLTILRNQAKLQDQPRVHVGTVHSVKGGEADHVCLLRDVSRRSHEAYIVAPDDELRVWYVGTTRARESISLVEPRGRLYIDL